MPYTHIVQFQYTIHMNLIYGLNESQFTMVKLLKLYFNNSVGNL